jgi:hypothetical protein
MSSMDRLAMLNYQDQDLDPIVENFVKDSKGSDAFRPNPLQASAQRFASSGVGSNSLQAAIDLLFQSRIQSVVLSLCRLGKNQFKHGDHYNSLHKDRQEPPINPELWCPGLGAAQK